MGRRLQSPVFPHGVTSTAHRDRPREKAAEILRRAEEGAFADTLLDRARQAFDARDAAFILELVYGVLRNQALLDWKLNQLSVQPVEKTDSWTRNILRLGAYQMLFLDRVPVSAAVNTATDLAREYGKKSSYVNGLLRNLDRKRAVLVDPGPGGPAALSVLYSHPEWLVKRWVQRFGEETAEAFLRGNNRPAPLVVRTNTLKTTRDRLRVSLEAENAEVAETACSTVGLEILSSPGLRSLSAYKQGWFTVQDEAAQLIGLMLGPRPGETVLDACAAPGGKATHLAELMENRGALAALENDPERIGKIRENSERLGITIITPVAADAAQYGGDAGFDKILIDAPCSGLGVLRRHPDGRWRKTEKTIRGRAAGQRRILENCSKLLKPGGALVYATCTTEPEENENVITAFLAGAGTAFTVDNPRQYLPERASRLVDERGFFRTFPREPDMDGFFGVRLVKNMSAGK